MATSSPPPLPPSKSNRPDAFEELTRRLRVGLVNYVSSPHFRKFVIRGLNQGILRWWHPIHRLAISRIVKDRTKKAMQVASNGLPMVGLVMMQNVSLRNRNTASSALIIGSFEFSPEGVENLDRFAEQVDRCKLRMSDEPAFHEYLAGIYSDEEYTEGRRRLVPPEYTEGEEIFFMDVMMRGDDPVDTEDGRLVMGHPLLVLLGEPGPEGTHCEVLPQKISRLGMPVLLNQPFPDRVRIPTFRSPVLRFCKIFLIVLLITIALFGVAVLTAS